MGEKRQKPSLVWSVVGVVGELLITAGILLGLFIVWQVWWTNIEANREQAHLVSEFGGKVDNAPDVAGPKNTDNPPVVKQEDVDAFLQGFEGDNKIWAVAHIPDFGADFQVGVAEGVDLATVLDKGSLGRYPDSQLPGEVGNFALAGHRQSYGAPLEDQPSLEPGDPIIIETAEAWYVYRVTEDLVVWPNQVEVIDPNPDNPGEEPTKRMLTLTTCHPPFVSNQRWITHAELDYWTPRSEGKPAELTEAA